MSSPDAPRESASPLRDDLDFKHEIAADTAISGRIHFPGDARVDGKLKGEVRADALLVIGESGELQASVRAERLVVLGTLRGGDVQARVVELHRGSRLLGELTAERLIVHAGAILEGPCEIGRPYVSAVTPTNVILLERPIFAAR